MQAGFIGLGAMGQHMARNLLRAGLLAGAWNRTAAKAEALAAETGCRAFATPAELAAACDVVVTCVSADADLLAVVDAIRPTLRKGSIVIDCSTVAADTARAAAERVTAVGSEFLDCPVSGGVEGAKNATLAIMCGGDAAAFDRARPVLDALGKTVVRMGGSGTGQATKATNQILCAGAIQVAAEAMAFARAEGLPLDRVIEILGKGAGSSWYFVNRAPFMVRGEYPAARRRAADRRGDARGLRAAPRGRTRRGGHRHDLPAQGPPVPRAGRWLNGRLSTCPTSAGREASSP
jgi:3-hydroxyisobutyrate dehydrogenase